MQEITSTNNAKIKQLIQLQKKSSLRKARQEFVVEGKREVSLAVKNDFQIDTIYFLPELISIDEVKTWNNDKNIKFNIIAVSKKVFQKITYRNTTEGLLAVVKMKEHSLNSIKLSENPLLLIAESIEKPGNIGAMLRSVDGAGADALILVNPVVDLYNPNLIRASLGTLFSNQIAITDTSGLQDFLQKNNIDMYAATLQNANAYYLNDYKKSTAIAVGAEDVGLHKEMRKIAKKSIYIPMLGQADSLNVSVSAALLLYEVLRQRKMN
jgi:TrmH family RNA methyltransferase